ncbi:MAG: cyanase [Ectothiorhodospiraceae bacterium]
MSSTETTQKILAAKERSGLTWAQVAEKVGMSEVFTTSVCYGMNSMTADMAKKLCQALDLDSEVEKEVQKSPHKSWPLAVPQDPLVYRLYEAIMVYGDSVKDIVHEKFGDGIMSAIDYEMYVDKKEDPKGDRVVITMNGKFLPFKRW